MAIRWIRNILVDGEKNTVEVQIGDLRIGDKCYTRINTEIEQWFENRSDIRSEVLALGVSHLRQRFEGKSITTPEGQPFDWR